MICSVHKKYKGLRAPTCVPVVFCNCHEWWNGKPARDARDLKRFRSVLKVLERIAEQLEVDGECNADSINKIVGAMHGKKPITFDGLYPFLIDP
jgi:hypothetical protein